MFKVARARLTSVVKQSDEIVLATVGTNSVNFSYLTDFKIDFEDRQNMKIIADYVLDLEVILPGMLDSIKGVRDQCMSDLTSYDHEDDQRSEMEAIIEELDEYIGEVRIHIERAKNLKDKANSTTKMVRQNSLVRRLQDRHNPWQLSDLLNLEEIVGLKHLAQETQLESRSMRQFTVCITPKRAVPISNWILGEKYKRRLSSQDLDSDHSSISSNNDRCCRYL
jgi:hypothetical protein